MGAGGGGRVHFGNMTNGSGNAVHSSGRTASRPTALQ
jgi:hypothetical protein